jgi:choline dehydrogenase-like flavoprotein
MEFVNGLTHAATFGVLIADQGKGRVMADAQGTAAVLYNLTKEDIALFHKGVVKMGEICWAAGAKRVQPTYLGHTPAPGDLALTSYHPLGTCRMGTDPRTSVVDLDHETHDAKGLFLVDGSVVSGPLGVNPQLTIMAVATRAADRIAATLG